MVLLCSICLEGLGRKVTPQGLQIGWYFLKDLVLLVGLLRFRIGPEEARTARFLYRGFIPFLGLGALWTLLEMFNPNQTSFALAIIGIRAYWLWWLAPLVIAAALRRNDDRDAAVSFMAFLAIGMAILAAVQFGAPKDAAINQYAWGNELGIADVESTGRVRVTSTFAYVSGYSDFAIVALTVLLALGLSEGKGLRRTVCLLAAAAIGATLPMTGSRAPIVIAAFCVVAVAMMARILRSRQGRRIVLGVCVVGIVGWFASPDAVEGVASRFQGSDTAQRFAWVTHILPPVAIADGEFPMIGLGTGTQQNARFALHVRTDLNAEDEPGRYLIELGPLGYLLIWFARLGLMVALLRAMVVFRRHHKGTLAGASLALAGVTMIGNPTFDHVWQALFFTSLGIILQAAVALRVRSPGPQTVSSYANTGNRLSTAVS